uniref:Uncharacterized protein n=1 Tax=Anguilla anguilla TaxID=7936 RepID=A0A0E9W0X7_ANGAN
MPRSGHFETAVFLCNEVKRSQKFTAQMFIAQMWGKKLKL